MHHGPSLARSQPCAGPASGSSGACAAVSGGVVVALTPQSTRAGGEAPHHDAGQR